MSMKSNFVKMLLGTLMAAMLLTGCRGEEERDPSSMVENSGQQNNSKPAKQEATGRVYYLSFKPENADTWEMLAEEYTNQTGVPVKVVTAASNTYEQTLMAEISNKEAPTLFQINGPIGYANWKEYCTDLSGTNLYNWLLDKSLAITGEDGGVYGIPYVVEGYGIIYNDAIMNDYFSMEGAVVSSMEEVTNFETLKALVEDMQAKKDNLGIKGVFASTSLMPGEDWRWQSHLANIPFFFELQDKNVTDLDELDFSYAGNFKNIFDLYLNNSCTAPGLLGSRSVDDSMAEFALGQVAMVQNGNWAWSQIAGVEENMVREQDVKFLPIYTGIDGEENYGICVGTENYLAVNSQVSAEDREASIAFMEWVFSSDTGKEVVTEKLGFIAPFTTFGENESPEDPLAQEVIRYMADESKQSIPWNFTIFPSVQFKEDFGAALLEYASGSMKWDVVKERVVESWAAEKAGQ